MKGDARWLEHAAKCIILCNFKVVHTFIVAS
jgi:hypothetical protein